MNNYFEIGDRVIINAGEGKGRIGIIYKVLPPSPSYITYSYLVEVKGHGTPWFAESELEMAKQQVVFT